MILLVTTTSFWVSSYVLVCVSLSQIGYICQTFSRHYPLPLCLPEMSWGSSTVCIIVLSWSGHSNPWLLIFFLMSRIAYILYKECLSLMQCPDITTVLLWEGVKCATWSPTVNISSFIQTAKHRSIFFFTRVGALSETDCSPWAWIRAINQKLCLKKTARCVMWAIETVLRNGMALCARKLLKPQRVRILQCNDCEAQFTELRLTIDVQDVKFPRVTT